MRTHSSLYQRSTLQTKRGYTARVAAVRSERYQELADQMDALRGDISVRRMRLSEEAARAKPAIMNSALLDDSDMATFASLWSAQGFNRAALKELRAQAMQPAMPPGAAELLTLKDNIVWEAAAKPKPDWLAGICKNRKSFANTALMVGHEARIVGVAGRGWGGGTTRVSMAMVVSANP